VHGFALVLRAPIIAVEAARRAGWDAVLFTGAADVATALDAAGWTR